MPARVRHERTASRQQGKTPVLMTNHSVPQEIETGNTPNAIQVRSRWLAHALTFLMVFGPSLIVMEADNNAGAVNWIILVLLFALSLLLAVQVATSQFFSKA